MRPSRVLFGERLGAILWRAEHAAGGVGAGVGDEGADQDVDQQRRTVVGQVAQQHRVDERDADPDDAEQRHPHRDRDAVAMVVVGAEEEKHREGGGENQQDVEGGAEVGGDDQRRDRDVGGDAGSAAPRPVIVRYSRRQSTPIADHRDREDEAAGDGDRDREDDRRDRDEDAFDRLAIGAALAPWPARRPWRPFGCRLGTEQVVVEEVLHQVLAPKRRWRASNSRRQSSSAARSKSGQSSSRKTNSE